MQMGIKISVLLLTKLDRKIKLSSFSSKNSTTITCFLILLNPSPLFNISSWIAGWRSPDLRPSQHINPIPFLFEGNWENDGPERAEMLLTQTNLFLQSHQSEESFIRLFIHSFIKYLLNAYHMPHRAAYQSACVTEQSKLWPCDAYIPEEETAN